MLSFTVAHASVIALRVRRRGEESLYRARLNVRLRGIEWPLFALVGGLGTGIAWLVVVWQDAATRWAGLAWLALGLAVYVVYRLRVVNEPLTKTVHAPVAYGPALALEYRRVLVPVVPGQASDEALDVACRLAAERGAHIWAVTVLEVPLHLPLTAELPFEEERADRELDEAVAIGETYGVRVVPRLLRARSAGPELVAEATRRRAEIIIVGTPRRGRRRALLGRTVDHVLKNAPCRVMVAAGKEAA
jgi:APA family basic amino acid/polyamine antiporter